VLDVSAVHSRARVLVVRADEELSMACAAASLLASSARAAPRMRVPIAVSARHAHLSQATLDVLFGRGHELRPLRELSQQGQFAAQDTVRLIGPHGSLEHVRVMGPPRAQDQVEVSRSDEIALGLDAPLRLSGDLAATPGVILEGPLGRVALTGGVICARRHIHMNPADATRFGLHDHDRVSVRIDSAGRDLTFDDVCVRVAPDFSLELHLDTDEANAAQANTGDYAELLAPAPAPPAV
jgi:acetate kinase